MPWMGWHKGGIKGLLTVSFANTRKFFADFLKKSVDKQKKCDYTHVNASKPIKKVGNKKRKRKTGELKKQKPRSKTKIKKEKKGKGDCYYVRD